MIMMMMMMMMMMMTCRKTDLTSIFGRFNLDPFHNHNDVSIWNALKMAELYSFVSTLPGGKFIKRVDFYSMSVYKILFQKFLMITSLTRNLT